MHMLYSTAVNNTLTKPLDCTNHYNFVFQPLSIIRLISIPITTINFCAIKTFICII